MWHSVLTSVFSGLHVISSLAHLKRQLCLMDTDDKETQRYVEFRADTNSFNPKELKLGCKCGF
jgi:hypothetical protein